MSVPACLKYCSVVILGKAICCVGRVNCVGIPCISSVGGEVFVASVVLRGGSCLSTIKPMDSN